MADGNITVNDAYKLKRLTHKLYEYIYARYSELREVTDMTEKDAALVEKDNIIAALLAENEALRMAIK